MQERNKDIRVNQAQAYAHLRIDSTMNLTMTRILARLPDFAHKPRVFILSDIENEPDDQQSLVRYLLYANEFDTRGICAVTSAWLPTRTAPEAMVKIVRAYGQVVPNLNNHVSPAAPFPSGEALERLISSGWPVCFF